MSRLAGRGSGTQHRGNLKNRLLKTAPVTALKPLDGQDFARTSIGRIEAELAAAQTSERADP
jgi:hypothetical protein